MHIKAKLEGLRDAVLDTVFPPLCIHCGGLVEGGELRHVCAMCDKMITRVEQPSCQVCGHPFFGEVEDAEGHLCPHCEGLNPVYREGRTVVLFKGAARSLVHALKYEKHLYALEDMGRLAGRNEALMAWVRDRILVPVPLHPRKKRDRGYNQTELWARELARAAGAGSRVEQLLVRQVDTESQTHFDRRTRMQNLQNAFALARGAVINQKNKYLLVDDVFTTGSTLNSCAKVLRKAGAVNLDVITFGHG